MIPRSSILLAFVAIGCSPADDNGSPPPPSKVVEWTASAENLRPAADGGTLVDIALTAQVEPGWKLYSLTQKGGGPVAMTVTLDSLSPYKLAGDVTGPAAERAQDPNFGIETETYSGAPAFIVPVLVPAIVDSSQPIELRVRSQACSDRLCLPARTTTVSVPPPLEGA